MKIYSRPALTGSTPAAIVSAVGAVGTDSTAARSDHRHAMGPIAGTIDWGNQAITNLNHVDLVLNAAHYLTLKAGATNNDWTLTLPGAAPSGASFLRVPSTGVASFDQATYATQSYSLGGVNLNAAATSYFGINGWSATEVLVQAAAGQGGTARYLTVTLFANANSGSIVYTLRKNAADTTLTVTVPTLTTGVFEDVTHAPTVAGSDLLALSCVVGGAGQLNGSGATFEVTQS